ncbi:MAG: hypothetical protein AAF357_17810 [Verrucomicrobiota bacterium]
MKDSEPKGTLTASELKTQPRETRKVGGCCFSAFVFALLAGIALPIVGYWFLYCGVIRDPLWETGYESHLADEEAYEFFTPAAWIDYELAERRTLHYLKGNWRESDIKLIGSKPLDPSGNGPIQLAIGDWFKGEKPHRHWTELNLSKTLEVTGEKNFFYPSLPLLNPESKDNKRKQISRNLLGRRRKALPGYLSDLAIRTETNNLSQENKNNDLVVHALVMRPWLKGTPFPYGKEAIHLRPNSYIVDNPKPKDVDRLVVYSIDTVLALRSVSNEIHWALVFERAP